MSKPITAIYIHFLDYYHSNRAARAYLAHRKEVQNEAHLAFRIALLFAEIVIIPASSYFESPLCRAMLNRHPEFRRYGALKLSARDPSLAEHIESKRAAYDERSPEQFLKAYRTKNRVPFPGYIQKRSSSTFRISNAQTVPIRASCAMMLPDGDAELRTHAWPHEPTQT
jgi:hypothetical protein